MTNFTANEVEKEITSLLPTEEDRTLYLPLFLEALKKANSFSRNKWSAYCKDGVMRLVVGHHIVFTIHKEGIWLALDKQMLDEEKEKIKLESLKNEVWRLDKKDYPEYVMTPSINGWYTPTRGDLDSWHIIRDFHFKFIEKATQNCKYFKLASRNKHSQEFLQHLENELGQSVPSPDYINKLDAPALKNDTNLNQTPDESQKTVEPHSSIGQKSKNNGIKKAQEKANSQISEREFNKNYEKDLKKVSKLSIEKLLERIKGLPKTRDPIEVVSTRHPRNAVVVAIALKMANGVCQLCGNSAPFTKNNGTPYLEVHHIQWLSEGGLDDPENTVALCPNCHRKMHVLNLESDKSILSNLLT